VRLHGRWHRVAGTEGTPDLKVQRGLHVGDGTWGKSGAVVGCCRELQMSQKLAFGLIHAIERCGRDMGGGTGVAWGDAGNPSVG